MVPEKKKKILVVDDEPELRELLKEYLSERGFSIKTAADGKDALNVLDKNRVDVIVLDVVMPNMDGFAFLKKFKSSPKSSGVPVIMLTCKNENESVEKGIELQADFYLPKPVDLDNLRNFIEMVLD
jgi:DNA-binding response OmpR family regulator